MKRTLADLCLFVAACVGLLALLAVLTVAFEVPNKLGLDHASVSYLGSLAFDFARKHTWAVIRWGLVLYLAFPLISKFMLHKRHLRWNLSSEERPIHTAKRTPEIGSEAAARDTWKSTRLDQAAQKDRLVWPEPRSAGRRRIS